MNEQHDIQRLVDWLEGHPGELPPAELDREIVEAVYVLRPDLAPAHRIKMDDILARIETGPIAEHTVEHTVEESIEESIEGSEESAGLMALDTDDLKSFATEDVPTEIAMLYDPEDTGASRGPVELAFYKKHRRSLWTGAATISMAALVLFVVLPMDSRNAMMAGSPSGDAVWMSEETPLSLFEEDAPVLGSAPSTEALESRVRAPLPASPEPAPLPGTPDFVAEGNLAELSAGEALSQVVAEPPAGIGQLGKESSGAASSGGAGGAGPNEYGSGAGGMGARSGDVTSSPGIAWGTKKTQIDFEGMASYEELDVAEEPAASAPELARSNAAPATDRSRRSARSRQSKRQISDLSESAGASESAGRTAYRARTEADFADEEVLQEDAGTSSLEDAKRLSRITDYNPNWYVGTLSEDEVKMIQEGIGKDESSGRPNELSAMIGHPDYRVGQDMAFRAATMAHARGNRTTALALIQQGKARSSANTVFLSLLYNLEGEIHLARGDLAAAEQSFRTSADLNEARTR